ncbi:enoyl-CoA hydratase/isomerase family protein [Caulobacter endophyticus]|uniref:enoyl-CoA hydratase/isomerase family protein n=1 Tax=Caulobacter endophyticus TaxID=2172652 RepID=UPI00240EA42F|nr:enoyl-CoA hydratase/isomerase family protein [Caulobacter endophyticus]MDG2528436.1 enoyl-CoA hydratase/isomerase family protein [Caulobacter endophyticus]
MLHVSRPTGSIILLELDAPPANALGLALRAQLVKALDEIATDDDVRAVVLTGRGGVFCAGDDLREAAVRGDGALAAVEDFNRLMDWVEALRVPTIAAVDGWCFGGGLELALACDIRLASDRATFAASGVNIGLVASATRLPRLIGAARAKAHLLTGAQFDAARALFDGIVAAVHTPGTLLREAMKLAEAISSRAPLAVEATKRVVDGKAYVEEELPALIASGDHQEAIAAFMGKRTADFRRR